MSEYPKVYKVEAIPIRGGRVRLALFDVASGWDFTPEYRDGNGPNYMFEFDLADPRCPGFWTLVKQARAYEFDTWEDLPYADRIVDGEAAAEYAGLVGYGHTNAIAASWTGNAKKPSVHNPEFEEWATR